MKRLIKRLSIVLCLAIISILSISVSKDNCQNENTPVRTVELNNSNELDSYISTFSSFDNVSFELINDEAKFVGTKTYDMSDFYEYDNVSCTNFCPTVDITFEASYKNDGTVNLSAIMNNGADIVIDNVTGHTFINEHGEIDAVLDIDGEYVLLSDLYDENLIQNCGWFKKLVSAALATVAVTAFVASVMATGGASLGAVVGVCALVGAGVGGTTSAIVGAIDGEVSFGQVCANFGAGLVVGAATGALTGLVVGKVACYDVAFSKGSFSDATKCINYHFGKHGAEVGAKTASEYVKLAMNTARTVIKNGTPAVRAVTGATANVMRYEVGDYYIHMAIEGTKIIIVSFGLI